jgi:hypothetical protein
MSCTAAAATARPYGVKLVGPTWEQPPSSHYANRQVAGLSVKSAPPGKRGPQSALSDAELLELIRADLTASPSQGEGHRKVGARLRVRDGVQVGRRRVLRLMRENHLLSPCRGRRGTPVSTGGDHHPGAQSHAGHRRCQGLDGGGRLGLDIGGCRAPERRVRGLACLQTGDPVCGSGAHFPGADLNRKIGGGRRWPGPVSADGSRHPVSVRSFSEPVETLGH